MQKSFQRISHNICYIKSKSVQTRTPKVSPVVRLTSLGVESLPLNEPSEQDHGHEDKAERSDAARSEARLPLPDWPRQSLSPFPRANGSFSPTNSQRFWPRRFPSATGATRSTCPRHLRNVVLISLSKMSRLDCVRLWSSLNQPPGKGKSPCFTSFGPSLSVSSSD